MAISIFELFSIGIGPSSSHTVGPMKAAHAFVSLLAAHQHLAKTEQLTVELYGSLALTGEGHGTDKAVLMGLSGELPDVIDPQTIESRLDAIRTTHTITTIDNHQLHFHPKADLLFHTDETLPCHTNGMRFTAFDKSKNVLATEIYYSIGGGFIVTEAQYDKDTSTTTLALPFSSAKELLDHCKNKNLSIAEVMMENEKAWHTEDEIKANLIHLYDVMRESIKRGCANSGILPGGLNVKRRAPELYQQLIERGRPKTFEHIDSMCWLNAFAIAVNEENAAGGRIVTAPTNGAAGIIPAVLYYYRQFYPEVQPENIIEFLLTAGAIAILYKKGASISGAEVGCQGEVGVASSMAAGALTAVLGGTVAQVENAAEIAMEHHLGMTCDPIGGLVQIPCIERNAMGSVKAVNAMRLAMMGTGEHFVPLDKVIATMLRTGRDMMSIYKETSLGGLAVNHPEC